MIYPPTVTGFNLATVKWTVIVLAVVALGLFAYSHGRKVRDGELARVERDTALAYAAEIVDRQNTADLLAAENAALRTTQAPKDRIITKEIIRYAQQTPVDRRCLLDGNFRVLHDHAATGYLPEGTDPGPLADGTADPVEDAAVLQTVGDNYVACRDIAARLEGWQRRQRALQGTAR